MIYPFNYHPGRKRDITIEARTYFLRYNQSEFHLKANVDSFQIEIKKYF